MEIYKIQAKKATCKAQAQRVNREDTQAQRVTEKQATATPTQTRPHVTNTAFPHFEINNTPHNSTHLPNEVLIISQDDGSPPAGNTQQQHQIRMFTQDYMLHMMEIPSYTAPFTLAQAASHKYPLQCLCDFAYTALDDDTGNLLEYRHLIKDPK